MVGCFNVKYRRGNTHKHAGKPDIEAFDTSKNVRVLKCIGGLTEALCG